MYCITVHFLSPILLTIELIYYNVLLCMNLVLHCASSISVRLQLYIHQRRRFHIILILNFVIFMIVALATSVVAEATARPV